MNTQFIKKELSRKLNEQNITLSIPDKNYDVTPENVLSTMFDLVYYASMPNKKADFDCTKKAHTYLKAFITLFAQDLSVEQKCVLLNVIDELFIDTNKTFVNKNFSVTRYLMLN